MKLNKYVRRIACCLTVVALLGSAAHAQMVERLCRTDYEIDPERQGELLVELDNISFFKDNEKIGQMLIIKIQGKEITNETKRMIEEYKVGIGSSCLDL